jgi:hypothetical protein
MVRPAVGLDLRQFAPGTFISDSSGGIHILPEGPGAPAQAASAFPPAPYGAPVVSGEQALQAHLDAPRPRRRRNPLPTSEPFVPGAMRPGAPSSEDPPDLDTGYIAGDARRKLKAKREREAKAKARAKIRRDSSMPGDSG